MCVVSAIRFSTTIKTSWDNLVDAAMDIPTKAPRANPVRAYRDVFERGATDAAFLWLLRSIAVDQPHYSPADLAELEQRLDAQLDLLRVPWNLAGKPARRRWLWNSRAKRSRQPSLPCAVTTPIK